MAYADFQAGAAYDKHQSGAAFKVLLYDTANPGDPEIAGIGSFSYNDDLPASPVAVLGETGIDEHVPDQHAGSGQMAAFWTPRLGDSLPVRDTFIGKTYAAVIMIGDGRPGAGTITDAFEGLRFTGVRQNLATRGARTADMSFVYTKHLPGKAYADETGA